AALRGVGGTLPAADVFRLGGNGAVVYEFRFPTIGHFSPFPVDTVVVLGIAVCKTAMISARLWGPIIPSTWRSGGSPTSTTARRCRMRFSMTAVLRFTGAIKRPGPPRQPPPPSPRPLPT